MPTRQSAVSATSRPAAPPRRRLTREESRAQTREQLLAAAHETFARRGFEGCSVDDLAEAAGYSKGAFYSNFPSKEAIFLELLRRHKATALSGLERLFAVPGSVEHLLERLADYSRQLEANLDWCLLTAEFQVYAARRPAFRAEFNALCTAERAAVGRFVGALYERAGLKPPVRIPPAHLAAALMAMLQGLALQRAADPKSLPAGAVGALTGFFQRALLASAAPAGKRGRSAGSE